MAYKLKQKHKKEEEQCIIWNVNLADEPAKKPKKKKSKSQTEVLWDYGEYGTYDLKRHD
jgi:1,2-phenylacetyl-CoA epoxidase PaaB subunit